MAQRSCGYTNDRNERPATFELKVLVDEAVDGVDSDPGRRSKPMSPVDRSAGEVPVSALGRHLRSEKQRQPGRIAVGSRGIVGSGDERAANPSTSRARQREVKGVLVLSVLGHDLRRQNKQDHGSQDDSKPRDHDPSKVRRLLTLYVDAVNESDRQQDVAGTTSTASINGRGPTRLGFV